ncbi:MAG: NAD(P)/FAD-dependent oxidoreductase [Pseudomonadota bacterium]
MNTKTDVAIIGAGPAGLTAAYQIMKSPRPVTAQVYEAGDLVGGISRTESYKGFRIDIGGHRFFTKVKEVEALWKEILGSDFIKRPRQSRIFYRGKFYQYPLKIFNALGNIGAYESTRIMLSYIKRQIKPMKTEEDFENWVINRFGGRLYMHFFRSYTQKVWGIHPRNIQADWAAQRIKNLSLNKAVWNAISGANDTASLIEEFDYPRLGPGMMWERCTELVEAKGIPVKMKSYVKRLERDGNRITAMVVDGPDGETRVEADQFINSMGLRDLIKSIDPPPPQHVLDAADQLKYRDFLIVALLLEDADPFPDNWVYVHSDHVKVGRIQNFRAWSREMVPSDHQSSIGMEYFCQQNDDLWDRSDEDLIAMAGREVESLGLSEAKLVSDGMVIRQPKAYPVYDTEYKAAVDTIAEWIKGLENLQTVGRNGLHRYNNQDHSMLTAMYAVENIFGAKHDLWSVNVERSYHEEMQIKREEGEKEAEYTHA